MCYLGNLPQSIHKTSLFFSKYLLLISLEREGEEHEHQSAASHMPPIGDRAQNLDVCPNQESNWQPLNVQDCAQ